MPPDPLVPADCDCTDLDGFMLNVERLMASELVALSSHEVIAAALFLWCRAWKQRPAASLPDDDRVLASFARLPFARFMKLKNEVLRGFVKYNDGRLYHRVLAAEATKAFAMKLAYRAKRQQDNERLKKHRQRQRDAAPETRAETPTETPFETAGETHFVSEGQGQGQGQGQGESLPERRARRATRQGDDPRKQIFDAAVSILGAAGREERAARSIIAKWCKVYGDTAVTAALRKAQATPRADPVSFITACLKRSRPPDQARLTVDEIAAEADEVLAGADY
jgi:hypothetical protein